MYVFGGHRLQLGHMLANECSIWILILSLFGDVIYSHRIYTGGTGLHLELRVVYAGLNNIRVGVEEELAQCPRERGMIECTHLVIQEDSSEMTGYFFPVKPQIVCRKRHKHGPHPEVEPATTYLRKMGNSCVGDSAEQVSPNYIE